MHVQETAEEVDKAVELTGKRPLARLHELGLVAPDLLAVHMTQLTSAEIAAFAAAGAHVVHCPESNLKLASGICPAQALLAAGINVALGTDGAASNNDLDMIGEMRTAALLGKIASNDASALPAYTVLPWPH
jgi:5-methylthioadenosine/S-adenosylhomocysteine deaminase